MKKMEMEDDQFVPQGLDMGQQAAGFDEEKAGRKLLLFARFYTEYHATFHFFQAGKKEDVESGPEEEEVPTRGFLKRQANMIVDAKSRSKRGSRRR